MLDLVETAAAALAEGLAAVSGGVAATVALAAGLAAVMVVVGQGRAGWQRSRAERTLRSPSQWSCAAIVLYSNRIQCPGEVRVTGFLLLLGVKLGWTVDV